MKKVIYTFAILTLAVTQQVQAQSDSGDSEQKILLKNWTLSRCLAQVYTDTKTKDDANATAAAYLEAGRQSIDSYESLDALIKKYVNKKYSGSIKSEFNTMKCIDLLNSKELDSLSSKLIKRSQP